MPRGSARSGRVGSGCFSFGSARDARSGCFQSARSVRCLRLLGPIWFERNISAIKPHSRFIYVFMIVEPHYRCRHPTSCHIKKKYQIGHRASWNQIERRHHIMSKVAGMSSFKSKFGHNACTICIDGRKLLILASYLRRTDHQSHQQCRINSPDQPLSNRSSPVGFTSPGAQVHSCFTCCITSSAPRPIIPSGIPSPIAYQISIILYTSY